MIFRRFLTEKRGSFRKFCRALGGRNITEFNYRNFGADYGSILVGMQVPKGEQREFQRFLGALGYPHADETRNPAYRLFLG